jgi:hypothetical protein
MPRKSVSEKSIVVSTGAVAAVPARRKSTSTKRSARTVEVPQTQEVSAIPEAAVPVTAGPSREEIARLAYSYWEARGCVGGSQDEDWHRAEQELRTR